MSARAYRVLVLLDGDWTLAETGDELGHAAAHALARSITEARPYPFTRVVPLDVAA